MNKSAIQKYAIWARNELREQVSKRAFQYGITPQKDLERNLESIEGRVLSKREQAQRNQLIDLVHQKGFDQVIEEVAYTWFNRMIALRFMEVNDYLPEHIRVFSNSNNEFKPEILSHPLDLNEEYFKRDLILRLIEEGKQEELYRYLFLSECNSLNQLLPEMFEKVDGYTELLLPNNLLNPGSIIGKLVTDIDEVDWKVVTQEGRDKGISDEEGGQVQIIGWLYQYYISEKHDEVLDILSKKGVSKEDIPAATQLFTPDWIVRYMVENSLGRIWLEGHPNDNLRKKWKYYLGNTESELKVSSNENRDKYSELKPEDLRIADIAMGSGHILVYAFDILMQIYHSQGVRTRDAVKSILENNLYGLDIDDRAAQLSYFAIMMKAREYDRRILTRGIRPNLFAIQESNGISHELINYFANGDNELKRDVLTLVSELKNAKEYGSVITVSNLDFTRMELRLEKLKDNLSLDAIEAKNSLYPLVKEGKILARKYHVVVLNPPYLNKYNDCLKNYIQNRYKEYSSDLYSVFIVRSLEMLERNGYSALMTPMTWMFLKSYQRLRELVISEYCISSLIQLEYSAYREATVPICTFIIKNECSEDYGTYLRLSDFKGGMEVQKDKTLEASSNSKVDYLYLTNKNKFRQIPGTPIAYWLDDRWFNLFSTYPPVSEIAKPRVGQNTGDNKRFLRLWFEVDYAKIGFGVNHDELPTTKHKWIPYSKGGSFRRWYGNFSYVINWENDAKELKDYAVIRNKGRHWSRYIQNLDYIGIEGLTWSDVSSGKFSCRYLPEGFICDVKGSSSYPSKLLLLPMLAFLNSDVAQEGLKALAPTISFQTGDIGRLPFGLQENYYSEISKIVNNLIDLYKSDWDSEETSWDFKINPLVNIYKEGKKNGNDYTIEVCCKIYEERLKEYINKSLEYEIKLNNLITDAYGLSKTIKVSRQEREMEVTLHKPDQCH